MSLDRDTVERLQALLREGKTASDIDLPRETRGAKPATKSRVNQDDVPRTTGGALWDMEVLEAWGRTIPVTLPSTGELITNMVEYDQYRVRDGSGAEGMLILNIATRVQNIT